MKTHFPLVVGNWKMHKTVAESKKYFKGLKPLVFRHKVGVWLAAPYTALAACVEECQDSQIQIGAQNMSDLMAGALTGEISSPMIKETGASFVILGHSERRRIFNEDNAMINRKIKLALRDRLKVILCIGETKEERESGHAASVLKGQLDVCLRDVSADMASQVFFAYEPVWAIGTSNPATVEIVEEIHAMCKNHIANYWELPADRCHILYGGSVNGGNAGNYLKLPAVDGLLVGAASLDVQSFIEIIHQAEDVR